MVVVSGQARQNSGSWRHAWWVAVLAIFVGLVLASAPAASQPAFASEHSLKAAFIYKFIGYVDWPAQAFESEQAPIVIAVRGDDRLLAELREIVADRFVKDRPLVVADAAGEARAQAAHVLYVAGSPDHYLPELPPQDTTGATLLITEFEGALDAGSMINFRTVDRRLRFEVSLESAEREGLKLSSRLLAVALHVRTGGP
ncbi:YfiR family protein [Kineobactrum salinum]|uniref:YfiR family protein n=1 Tax=Kineobactrum salinum TaxID=2708301 RepID=A0A6C0U1I1_9GAMM|nr:YfiR family protein [Kineobactrum salinum]QIB64837.1 YfiR family protein [Kineobactrum salinum]